MNMKTRALLALMIFTAVCAHGRERFANPVLENGADPWIVKHEGKYYYCCARGGNIAVSVSETLHEISPAVEVWKRPAGSWNSECVWAPELHPWNGKWYIIYAAGRSGPPFIHQKTGVLESDGGDPFGPYTDKGMVCTGDNPDNPESSIWAIDMTLMEHRGKLYGVWSGWESPQSDDSTPQHLYIAPMSDPWTTVGPRVKISSPDTGYETAGGKLPINEGPQILRTDKRLFIVYSCGQSWLDTYKLSWLTLENDLADPLDPASWLKSPRPVFTGNDQVHGVGHASFTLSPDDRQHYIVYHTKKGVEPGWRREVWMQPFSVDRDGYPVFGEPVGRGVEQPLPSGTKQKNIKR
jgi:GH43 family beta-xylosidase